ncbi:MAG TPA: P-loop NTPase, partial [Herpetosiphonaceae bacterium]|nr:P-loop NTPase [Herpetosiphonaceae bacterium]
MGRRIEGMARILAVASGKGGVGKTTVSVNLALALAAGGSRVGLFDADIYGPNVPLMLGVPEMRSAQIMLPVARADSMPYLMPLWRYGLHVMSIGLLVADTDAVMPDPRVAGMLVTQTINDVVWGELD